MFNCSTNVQMQYQEPPFRTPFSKQRFCHHTHTHTHTHANTHTEAGVDKELYYRLSHLQCYFRRSFQSSKLKIVGLFCHVSVKRDVRARALQNVTRGGIGTHTHRHFECSILRLNDTSNTIGYTQGLLKIEYSLLHLECYSISISNLNLISLFSTERGKRDVANYIIDWALRFEKRHSKCNRLYH